MHEQRKPWVPLILEASYRPKGWLGIMLGSRLYYEFTEAALADQANWERLADGVAVEVRRHAPSAGVELQAVAPDVPQSSLKPSVPGVAVTAVTALAGSATAAAREARAQGSDAMPRGITVRSNVTNNTTTNNTNTIVNNNSGNIVLM